MENRTQRPNDDADPERIEREIAHTRESIESTVEELGQRLAPSQLVDDAKSYVKETAVHRANHLWGSVIENAVPLTLIGGGFWLLRSRRARDRSGRFDDGDWSDEGWREGRAHGAGGGRIGEMTAQAGEMASHTAQRASEMASHTAQRAREMTSHVRERGAELGSHAQQSASRQLERARHGVQSMQAEQPLVLGVAALALGALVGGALPSTRREDELVGETRDEMLRAAAEAGREKAEQAKQALQSAAQGEEEGRERGQQGQGQGSTGSPG